MSRKLLAGCLALLLLPIIACNVYWWLADHPPFPIAAVALPPDLFPDDKIFNHMHTPSEFAPAAEAGIQAIYWSGGNGLAVYNVDRFLTRRGVERLFQWHVDTYTSPDPNRADRLYPHLLTRAVTADSHFAGCGISEFVGFRCVYVAIYDHYVAHLSVTIDDKIPVEQFDQIVYAVDDLFSAACASVR